MRTFLKVLCLFAFAFLYALLVLSSSTHLSIAQTSTPAKFRIQGTHEFVWIWGNTLNFRYIENMCWNSDEGFNCDSRLSDDSRIRLLQTVLVFEDTSILNIEGVSIAGDVGDVGLLYQVTGSPAECFVWWFGKYSLFVNSHPKVAMWVTCPEPIVNE